MAKIENIKVFGIEDSFRASKYPFATDINNCFDMANWNYWNSFKGFIADFFEYQKGYGKEKFNKGNVCCFCGSSTNVETFKDSKKKYCSKHRHQLERYGKCFETTPKYELLDEYVLMTVYGDMMSECSTKISYESLPYVFYWGCRNNGGKYVNTDNGTRLHIRLLESELIGEKVIVDHINRDIHDNRLCNLRISTCRENVMNSSVARNNNSGVIGVSYRKDKKKWRAYINDNYKQVNLGNYHDKDDAIKARLIAEKAMYGEYAPQKHLYKEYGIEYDEKSHTDKLCYDLKVALNEYKRGNILATSRAGCGEDNFLNGIVVQFDLTFSNKAWVELQRYHFIDFVSSQSTMHCISKMDIKCMCNDYVSDVVIAEVERLKEIYLNTKDSEDYLRLLYNIPSGFELTARMTTNYRQLKTIYKQRRNHRLPDWHIFCDFIEKLPHSELITGKDD